MISLNLSESAEQKNLVACLRMSKIVFFSVPNGADVPVRNMMTLKAEGLTPGAPDLVLVHCAPANGRPTMIEMKKKKKAVYSEEQLAIHAVARAEGWNVITPPKGESRMWVLRELVKLGYPLSKYT